MQYIYKPGISYCDIIIIFDGMGPDLYTMVIVHWLSFDSDLSAALEDINLDSKECGTVQINHPETICAECMCLLTGISLCTSFQQP